jgi:hypothetical protein
VKISGGETMSMKNKEASIPHCPLRFILSRFDVHESEKSVDESKNITSWKASLLFKSWISSFTAT